MILFTTTDLYLAAFMKIHCLGMNKRKAGEKIIFDFEFNEDGTDTEKLQNEFYENEELQKFISAIKEVRNDIYKLMRK